MEARRAIATETDGFTLPELLIATVIGLIVIGAAVTAMTVSVNSQPRLNSQAASVQQARTTMERITRELRQGSSVPNATASQLSIVTYVEQRDLRGDGGHQLDRMQGDLYVRRRRLLPDRGEARRHRAGSRRAGRLGALDAIAFTYTPPSSAAPAYVGVTLSFPAQRASRRDHAQPTAPRCGTPGPRRMSPPRRGAAGLRRPARRRRVHGGRGGDRRGHPGDRRHRGDRAGRAAPAATTSGRAEPGGQRPHPSRRWRRSSSFPTASSR